LRSLRTAELSERKERGGSRTSSNFQHLPFGTQKIWQMICELIFLCPYFCKQTFFRPYFGRQSLILFLSHIRTLFLILLSSPKSVQKTGKRTNPSFNFLDLTFLCFMFKKRLYWNPFLHCPTHQHHNCWLLNWSHSDSTDSTTPFECHPT